MSHSFKINGTALANSATIEATTADTANKIAQRNGSGDIFARLFRSDYQNQSTCTGAIAFRTSTSDNYIRFCSDMGAVRTKIGCAAVAGSTGQNFSSKECYVQNWVRTKGNAGHYWDCLLYTSPSPRDRTRSRMPSSA